MQNGLILRFVWIVYVLAWWGATAWLARQPSPWALRLTNPAFAAGLLWTYVAAAAIILGGARDRRTILFRVAAATMGLHVCVCLLESSAVSGHDDIHPNPNILRNCRQAPVRGRRECDGINQQRVQR